AVPSGSEDRRAAQDRHARNGSKHATLAARTGRSPQGPAHPNSARGAAEIGVRDTGAERAQREQGRGEAGAAEGRRAERSSGYDRGGRQDQGGRSGAAARAASQRANARAAATIGQQYGVVERSPGRGSEALFDPGSNPGEKELVCRDSAECAAE